MHRHCACNAPSLCKPLVICLHPGYKSAHVL